MKEYIKRVGKFVVKYMFTILSLLYITLIVLVPIKFSFSIAIACLILSLFFILNLLAKIKYRLIPTIIFAFILVFNAYFAFVLKSDVSLEIMASILETHMAEAVSMVKGEVLLGAIIGITATTALLYASEKELKAAKIPIKISVVYLSIYCLLFLPVICYKRIKWMEEEELFKEVPIRVIQDKVNMYAPVLYGNIFTILAYEEEMSMLREFSDQSNKTLPEGILLNDTIQTPQKIYLVIGESAYRKHWSLYGYPTKTTPFVDSLYSAAPDQLSYYNGVASAPFTRNAIRMALSFASPTNMEPFYSNKTLLELARDAKYNTFWISNQGSSGIQDSYLGYIAACADRAIFTEGGYLANDDLTLIPLLKKEHNDKDRQFFVIHLVGSHNNYSDRYDASDVKAIPGSNTILNNYDRSIHHTDRVLHEIYNIMQQDSTALLFYFSDHGEIVGRGHGPWKNGIAQFDIPLITINRNTNKIDSVSAKYQEADTAEKLINNSSTIYILAEMMGYFIPEKYIKRAVSDGKYVRHADQSYSLYSDIKEEAE